jgi:plastocyanin
MRSKVIVFLLVVLVVGAVALIPSRAGQRTDAREIVLVARNMAFYLAEDPSRPNPTLRMKPGEGVRVVLRSTEPGMAHDFAIRALNVSTDLIVGDASTSVRFRVPERERTYEYACTPHSAMMNGTVLVQR